MRKDELVNLLNGMSLEDKISQLLQLSGSTYEDDDIVTGPNELYGIKEEEIVNNTGSVLNSMGAEKIKRIQDRYLKITNNNIPLMFMADIINGFKTIFPIPLGTASSWNMDMIKKTAQVAAHEAAVSGLHVTFSPMVDLVRDARWGRVLESSGEDPYLNCQIAKAMVEGYQGDNLSDPERNIAACVKHFAAYGAPFAGREYNTVDMSERVLRQDYLPSYKAAIDAGCEMVMTSFNVVNGIPSSANKWLNRDILREEMGFDGILISDASAIEEIIAHGVAEDKREAAKMAIEAGVDIDMMTSVYVKNLKGLIESGEVKEELLDEAVLRILELKNKLGLFENPYRGANAEREKEVVLCKEYRDFARETVAKSCVLLKNDGVLPLKKDMKKLALIGPYADNQSLCGIWSINCNDDDVITLKQGIEEKLGKEKMIVAKGSKMLEDYSLVQSFGNLRRKFEEPHIDKDILLSEAREAAKDAEVIVLALGEHFLQSGEGGSRADITLPQVQIELFNEMIKLGKPVVVVLFSGRPLDLRAIEKDASAILEAWLPGTEGGNGVADVLFNDITPSGKLTMSFPYCVGQVPVFYNELHTGRPYDPKFVTTRFGSKYTDIPNEPLYPFGYGLSYTTFEYGDVELSSTEIKFGETVKAKCLVKNTGEYEGEEIVQLYIQDCVASVARPVKELKGFKTISLAPGQEKIVEFEINEDLLKFYTARNKFEAEAGKFKVYIGGNSAVKSFSEFKLC